MNLRITVIAALLCGVVSMAAAQTVTCPDCTHVVPVYMGEGGLIATADADAKMVYVVATCGNAITTGELTPDADGMVAMLFDGPRACAEGGTLEIGPVMDGGWYWISDEMHSAVGSLVSKATLGNDRAKLASAGEGVTMSFPGDDKKDAEDKGAVLLKETSSGRIGILPTILPEPPVEPAAKCGYGYNSATFRYWRRDANCMQGDGGTVLRVQGPLNIFTGQRTTGNRIVRPSTGTVDVKIDLWGNGSGHFLTATEAATATGRTALTLGGNNFLTGHAGGHPLPLTSDGNNASPATDGGMTASLGGTESMPIPAADAEVATNQVGGMNFAVEGNVGTLTVGPHSGYCNPLAKPAKNTTATVKVNAYVAADQETVVTPTVATGRTNRLATSVTIMVVCPSGSAAAAHQGRDLVPENPFPPTSE